MFFAFFPGLIFFLIWVFFGRENLEADIPGELSVFPDEKKEKKNLGSCKLFQSAFLYVGR
jgi:hypothetical protein